MKSLEVIWGVGWISRGGVFPDAYLELLFFSFFFACRVGEGDYCGDGLRGGGGYGLTRKTANARGRFRWRRLGGWRRAETEDVMEMA